MFKNKKIERSGMLVHLIMELKALQPSDFKMVGNRIYFILSWSINDFA